MKLVVQTRSISGELKYHASLDDALNYAQRQITNDAIGKISFTIQKTNERVRLVKTHCGWVLESILFRIK